MLRILQKLTDKYAAPLKLGTAMMPELRRP